MNTNTWKKWVDAPPPHQDCPRAGWNWFIETTYVNKKGSNTHYRTKDKIDEMVKKLIPHEKFLNELFEAKCKRQGKQFKKMPPRLEELRNEAYSHGRINTNLWKLKYDKNQKITLTRKAFSTVDGEKKELFWTVEAIDQSYDILHKIHCKEGHCTGHEMWRYIDNRHFFSFREKWSPSFLFTVVNAEKK